MMVELNNTNVFINGYEFYAVRMVSLELSILPIKHPAEEVFTVTDHVRQLPNKFKLMLRMFDRWESSDVLAETREEKLDLIKKWYKDRKLNSLNTDLGDYENMLISNAKIVEDNTSDTSFDAEIVMEEVLVAYLQPIDEQWYIDTNGNTYEQSPYESSNLEGVLSKPKPSAKEKEGWHVGHNVEAAWDWMTNWQSAPFNWNWKWPWE